MNKTNQISKARQKRNLKRLDELVQKLNAFEGRPNTVAIGRLFLKWNSSNQGSGRRLYTLCEIYENDCHPDWKTVTRPLPVEQMSAYLIGRLAAKEWEPF